jgi:hypothetical protein
VAKFIRMTVPNLPYEQRPYINIDQILWISTVAGGMLLNFNGGQTLQVEGDIDDLAVSFATEPGVNMHG